MTSGDFIILLAAIAVFLPTNAAATNYRVGDEAGWTVDYDYQAWAKDKVFHVGDTLLFIFQKGNDSVYKANQTQFQNCIVPEGTPGLTSGHDEITLTEPGKTWYISGAPKHCSQHNQKLAIFVMHGGAPAPAPMAPMTPMAPMKPPPVTTPGPPTPVTTPAPPGNSAHGIQQASKYQVLFVAAVAFAAFLMA